ncbi:hypothetical protein EN829_071870, partial [Mesorhizobium sp. M00.F.Ca.ET.186.01.1.1]
LFLSGTGNRSHQLLQELQAREADVIEVTFGTAFQKGSDHRYEVGSADDFSRLLQELAHRDIRHIVHCMGVTEEKLACADDFHEWENRSVYSFYQLVC